MIRFHKLLIIVFILIPFVGSAQRLSNRMRRVLNARALQVVEQYETAQHFYDAEAEFLFEDIFQSRDQYVFCDLVDYKSCQMLPISEYISAVKRRSGIIMEIRDLKRGTPFPRGGDWVLPISFTKSVRYVDKNGLDFSSLSYYNSDYIITLELTYNAERDVCKVTDMSGRLEYPSVKPLPEHFLVVRKQSKKDLKLRYERGEKLEFKGDDAFVLDTKRPIQTWNADARPKVTVINKQDAYDLISYKYKKTHMRVKMRGAMAVGDAFRVQRIEGTDITAKSFGYEAGLDIGVAFFAGRSSQIGFYTGAAWNNMGISLRYYDESRLKMNYSLLQSSSSIPNYGEDGDRIERVYRIGEATEGLQFMDVSIPLYINFEHYLHKSVVLTWNLGGKMYFNMSAKYTPLTISGNYTESGKTTEFSTTFNHYLEPVVYNRRPYDFSLVGGIALNINLFKNYIYFYGKFSYEYGWENIEKRSLINELQQSGAEKFYDRDNKIYPVLYSGDRGEHIANKSMFRSVLFSRQTMWVEAGFMFKF